MVKPKPARSETFKGTKSLGSQENKAQPPKGKSEPPKLCPFPFDVIRAYRDLHREYDRRLETLRAYGIEMTKGPSENEYLYWTAVYMAWARADWLDGSGKTTAAKASLSGELSKATAEPDFQKAARSIVAARLPNVPEKILPTRANLLMPQIRDFLRFGSLKDALRQFKESIFAASVAADEEFFRGLAQVICNDDRLKKNRPVPLRLLLVDLWLPLRLWKLRDGKIRARLKHYMPGIGADAAKIKSARTQKPRLYSSIYEAE